MYGMVNQAVKDLVVSKFGQESWQEIASRAGLSGDDFVFMQYYSDKITYDLVGAASAVLKIDATAILREFGKHWILYTAKEGYGAMVDLFGADFKSCLKNLNNLHARMGMTMPSLTPPRFVFSEIDERTYMVQYLSSRAGLCPMVLGLFEGLAQKYKVDAKIELMVQESNDGTANTHSFRISIQG